MPVQSPENGRENIRKAKYGFWDINKKKERVKQREARGSHIVII